MQTITLNKGRHKIIVDDELYDYFLESDRKWTVTGVGRKQKVRIGPQHTRPCLHLHTEIMCPEEGQVVIFKNGNRFDFRRDNMMLVDRSYVGQRKQMPENSTGYRGVSKFQEGWGVKIVKNNKEILLGYYRDITHAARAYNIAAIKIFGEDAYQNDVPDDIVPVRYKLKWTLVLDTEEAQ